MTPTKVLLVEDAAGDALLVRQVLAHYRREVQLRVAVDGEQALDILSDHEFEPDLIILDLNLPKVSGIAFLEQSQRKDLPVVVFSSSQNPYEISHARKLGAREFVGKPLDLEEFTDAVRGIMDRWTEGAEACGAG